MQAMEGKRRRRRRKLGHLPRWVRLSSCLI
jgi:hypothetical protein